MLSGRCCLIASLGIFLSRTLLQCALRAARCALTVERRLKTLGSFVRPPDKSSPRWLSTPLANPPVTLRKMRLCWEKAPMGECDSEILPILGLG
jgi:hypothetical protein